MATRSATRRYADLASFLKEYKSTLRVGAVMLPAGSFDGELAVEIKLDFVLPLVGRAGPVDAQVVNRMPDGSVALRIPEPTAEFQAACKQVFDAVENIKQYLITSKQVFAEPPGADPKELQAAQARIAALEAELAAERERNAQLRARPVSGVEIPVSSPVMAPPTTTETGERARGLVVPDVSRVAPSRQGQLGDRSIRDGFMSWAIEKKTGLLTIRYPSGQTRWGFWYKGGPVGWRTNPMEESEVLGILLLRANQITKEQLQQSLGLMEQSGVRQGEALIEMGVMSFSQLVLLLQKQSEFALQKVFKETEGTWTFHDLNELPEKYVAPPVRVASILYRTMRQQAKELSADSLASYLKPLLDRYVFLAADVERTIEEMKLGLDDTAFIKIIRSTSYRLRELFAVSNLSRSATAAIIWTLTELNLLDYRKEEADARSADRLAKMLDDRRRQLVKGTLFDRLELHWICTRDEVEAAWKRFNFEFSPEKLSVIPPAQRAELDKFVKGGKDAYDRLLDDRQRREYRASIAERMMIEQSAEMLSRKGEMEVMRGNLNEAISCYLKALELMPNVSEYKNGLAQVRAMKG